MKEKLTIRERFQALKPGQVIWPLVIVLILLGVIVGVYNYQKNITATKLPTVEVTSPEDNTTVQTSTTKVTGTVEKGSKVTIGNKDVAVESDGSFAYEVPLNSGLNTITIVVTGTNGKTTITTRRVTYTAPAPVAAQPQEQAVAGSLSSSGPESYWIPEAALIAAAVVGYSMTKGDLKKKQRRQ